MLKKKFDTRYLPFIIIFAGTILFYFYDPPHSICSTQIESYKKSLKGKIYGYKDQKNIIPAKIKKAVEVCRDGKSIGSCIEYFELINAMMVNLNQVELECMEELFSTQDILDTLKRFYVITSVLAWGDEMPKETKTNWFSESNILVYCKVKKNLEQYLPKEDFDALTDGILNTFPYERLSFEFTEDTEEYQKNKAMLKLERNEVFNKSIMSLRCERYL